MHQSYLRQPFASSSFTLLISQFGSGIIIVQAAPCVSVRALGSEGPQAVEGRAAAHGVVFLQAHIERPADTACTNLNTHFNLMSWSKKYDRRQLQALLLYALGGLSAAGLQ